MRCSARLHTARFARKKKSKEGQESGKPHASAPVEESETGLTSIQKTALVNHLEGGLVCVDKAPLSQRVAGMGGASLGCGQPRFGGAACLPRPPPTQCYCDKREALGSGSVGDGQPELARLLCQWPRIMRFPPK